MEYIDFHTHQVPVRQDVVAVVAGRDTWGVHPWWADTEFAVPDLSDKLAIGECGLDALKGPAMEVQEEVFRRQIDLSERLGKPLIIHCVKALDRLLKMQKTPIPSQKWMLHGFRGKPRQLQSLLNAGFFVSFGFLHNEESLLLCPLDRLMLESDETRQNIAQLYEIVARKKGLDVTVLCETMAENYRTFFQKEPFRA